MHFTVIDNEKAQCDICKTQISIRCGSTSNLGKHLRLKHVSVVDGLLPKKARPTTATGDSAPASQRFASTVTTCVASTTATDTPVATQPKQSAVVEPVTAKKQHTLSHFVVRPASVSRQKRLNYLLIRMIAKDMQPFSIVSDEGFRQFVAALDPSYSLPDRKTLTQEFLPNTYRDVVDKVRGLLAEADAVTLTTDGWTSMTTEGYIAVTAHYITKDFTLQSCVLQCVKYSERHTSENLATDLKRCISEWGLEGKIQAVVTDNAANVTGAVRIAGLTHLFCFAHTLNLIVQNGIRVIKPLHDKVKAIVEYFHRSTVAAEKLRSLQQQMRPEHNAVKLKNDVITRWNSTYDMFRRIYEIREPVEAAIAVLQKPVETPTTEEWLILKEACEVLRPFQAVTTEISSEKSVTVSKVIVLVRGLKSACHKVGGTATTRVAQQLVAAISEDMNKRFANCEMNQILARSTFLDPRFKKLGFSSDAAFSTVKEKVTSSLANALSCNDSAGARQLETCRGDSAATTVNEDDDLIWGDFDRRQSSVLVTPSSSAIVEVRQYIEDAHIGRHEDPLAWWSGRQSVYPNLAQMARRYLCMVATSVPSERVFSKSGQLISERRTRLTAKTVEMVMFLNGNADRF